MKLGKYRHYKGKNYKVMGIVRHSETLEELVLYKSLYESKKFPKGTLWARPKKMFLENVKLGNKEVPRFKLIK